jgi:hypothetical protein
VTRVARAATRAGAVWWHTAGMLRPSLALLAVPLALGVALAPFGQARACGGMVFPEHSERVGGMREQEVMVVFQADRTIVVASAGYKGAEDGAAFLLPVRANPLEIHEAPIEVFVGLEEMTAPEVGIFVDSGDMGGSGCAGTKAGDAGGGNDLGMGGGDDDTVVSLQRGSTASYDYEVVGGDSGTDVVAWLGDNGYSLPDDYAGAIAPYVEDGYFFLAAKIKPGVAEGAMPPLEVHLPASEVEAFSVPFGLAAHSLPPGESLTIVTYLVATGAVAPMGEEAIHIDANEVVATSETTTNYQEKYDEVVQAGGWVLDMSDGSFSASDIALGFEIFTEEGPSMPEAKAAIDEFIARVPFDGRRITRLRATRTAEQLKDLGLRKVAGEDVSRRYDTTYNDNVAICSVGRRGVPMTAMLFPLLLVLRRRRR